MKLPRSRWIIIGLFLIILIGIVAYRLSLLKSLVSSAFMKYEPGSYAIKAFRDGDTIVVDMNGVDETIRFIGVDTPETHKPNAPVQCFGPKASDYTKSRIGKSRVRLVADRMTTNRDRYDRLLRYVVLEDGTYLNYELVQKGFAFAYDFPFSNAKKYDKAETTARRNKLGLWDSCTPTQNPNTGQWHSNDILETTEAGAV